ncbi:MAG: hypothetical protein K9L22_03105 [Methylococcaceae bacterium]|nr:hypothetical protein [Methylococcaceae bacterium]
MTKKLRLFTFLATNLRRDISSAGRAWLQPAIATGLLKGGLKPRPTVFNMFRLKLVATFLMLWGFISPVYADLDAMQVRMLDSYALALRWDNIESAPEWIGGEEPVYSADWGFDAVSLEPEQATLVYLEPYQTLRIYNPDITLQTSDFLVSLSNASGLAVAQPLSISSDQHSLLLMNNASAAQWVHIQRAKTAEKVLTVGLFVSRTETLPELAPYRDSVFLSDPWVFLKDKDYQLPELSWLRQPNQVSQFEITGPTRLVLKSRLAYESNAVELFQDYRIAWRIDQQAVEWLHFSTSAESRHVVRADFRLQVVSREEQHYLEIPAGQHTISLVPDRAVYLQVLEQKAEDYLFPGLNQPRVPVTHIRECQLVSPPPEINLVAQQAERLVKDNTQRENALLASNLLAQAALQRPDYPPAQTLAEKLVAQNSFYRHLLPSKKSNRTAQQSAYFLSNDLVFGALYSANTVVAEQHIDAAIKRLGQGYFTTLSGDQSEANHYLLPARSAASQLRVIVDKQACINHDFWLQFDQQAPIKMQLYCSSESSPEAEQQMSLAEAALLHLQNHSEQAVELTLSRAFAKYPPAGHLLNVANFELALPAQVKQIKVWQDNAKAQPLSVALQYRASKYFDLSEHSYLARLKNSQPEQITALFKQALQNQSVAPSVNENEGELLNEYQALFRLILAESRQYKASVPKRMPEANTIKSSAYLTKEAAKAQLAEQQKQWQHALSHWQHVVYASKGEVREQAQLAQANVLAQLSEDYLAKQLWRYLSVYASRAIAEQAIQRLIAVHQNQQDSKALQNLAAAMLVQWPESQYQRLLFDSFVVNQQYQPALLLGLSFLPTAPAAELVPLAYQLQWWATFDYFIEQLAAEQQAFWRGLRYQYQGDFQAALKAWDSDDNKRWHDYLQQGLELSALLARATQTNELLPRYQAWSAWQQQYPGQKNWRDATPAVEDYAGSDAYYSVERDVYDTAFRATANRPVTLSVLGPAKLQLHFRVLHPANQKESALDGWIEIKDEQQHWVTPFTNNTPVQGLDLVGDSDYQLGRKITLEYQVGEGVHKIALFSAQAPLSIQLEQYKPALPIVVLPELSLDTFNALHDPINLVRWPKDCVLTDNAVLVNTQSILATAISDCQKQKFQSELFAILQAEQLAVTPSSTLAAPFKEAGIKQPVINLQQAQLAMISYAWQIEARPEAVKHQEILVAAEQLALQYPDDSEINALWQRLSRSTQWQKVGNIINPAGVQFVPITGWSPESTALEARKNLLEPLQQDEHILFADKVLVFSMYNTEPISLHASLRLLDVPFLAEQDADLMYQVDDGKLHKVHLSRNNHGEQLTLKVPMGDHQLRLYVAESIGNQFVALRFNDHQHDLSLQQERAYFLSTVRQPLEVYVQGPAMLRIDEWRQGASINHYQAINKAGWQTVSLAPYADRPESLLRVQQRILAAETKQITNRFVERELVRVPVSELSPEPIRPLSTITLVDEYELGAQEDGTWGIGLDLQRRNNVQEDSSLIVPEQFAQFKVEHRYFDKSLQGYWFAQGLARYREHGGPTFGLQESFDWQPDSWPVNTKFNSHVFVQALEEGAEWLGQVDLAFDKSLRLMPKTTLTPELSFFARYLSLQNDSRVRDISFQQQVDQDVYTPYKADHRYGMNTALTLRHRPWLDTLWEAKIAAASNENFNIFNPDHMTLQAQWKQYLDAFQVNAGYRVSFYQPDNDRASSSTRSFVKFKLTWDHWLVNQNRLELGLQYNYDIERSEHLPLLSFAFHFGQGRGYRDFRPGELGFLPLMQQRIPNEQNNRIEEN